MGEIATDAASVLQGVDGRGFFVGRALPVSDMFENPIADRRRERVRLDEMAEEIKGLVPEPVRLAVAAREEVGDGLGREIPGSVGKEFVAVFEADRGFNVRLVAHLELA